MQQTHKNKTNLPNIEKNKTIPTFKDYMKDFSSGLPQQILNSLNKLPKLNNQFTTNLDLVKLYRPSLGTNIQANWVDFMTFMKKIILQINVIVKKVKQQCDSKIQVLVRTTTKYEKQNAQLRDKIQRLQTLRSVQNGQLDLANIQTDSLKRQISAVYQIVQKDMKKILDYLASIERRDDSQSKIIFTGLDKLANSLNQIELEKNTTTSTLSTMNELIKAMVKNSKMDNCTQVQESQLAWKATSLIPTEKTKIQLQEIQKNSINLEQHLQKNMQKHHIINQLKIKQKQIPTQIYNPKRNIERPWVLPPTILVFIENMSKENQNGRVLPWQHVKKTINQIYIERLLYSKQLINGLIGSATTFDEFFVLHFIKKYNMRRLAQLKMLQFIISLKYYCKFWQKAQTFCFLLDIMRYQPTFELNETNTYKFDIYVQNYFFYVFSKLFSDDIKELEQGSSYISFKRFKVMKNKILFFTDDFNRSRLYAKLEKTLKIIQEKQFVDFDSAILLSVDQFLNVRKKNLSILNKTFSKVSQSIQGFFSLKEMNNLFNQLQHIIKDGQGFGYKYPAQSNLQLSKLYLFSITSGKNGFDINGKQFSLACQKFGFDSPFPFLHVCSGPQLQFKQEKQKELVITQKKVVNQVKLQEIKNTPQKQEVRNDLLNKKIEIGSVLFSQHFAILRQLREYCSMFKQTLQIQKDSQKLWVQFGRILQILEKGCQFLKFPLKT